MYSKVTTGAVRGVGSYLLRVETNISNGLPAFNMVGFMTGEVREAGERVRVALKNAGIPLPASRITVNLAPADIPKRGIVIDLPVAVGELICMGMLRQEDFEDVLVAGELGLNGEIRPVRGVLPIVHMAREQRISTCILPRDNLEEGAVVEGIRVIGVRSLNELIMYMNAPACSRDELIPPGKVDVDALFKEQAQLRAEVDLADVRGQSVAKKAMEIAAAGFHNMLMTGPPGTGKSMLAKCLPGIMPPLSFEESMEVSAVYSVAGMLGEGQPLVLRHHAPALFRGEHGGLGRLQCGGHAGGGTAPCAAPPIPPAPPLDHKGRAGGRRDRAHAGTDLTCPQGSAVSFETADRGPRGDDRPPVRQLQISFPLHHAGCLQPLSMRTLSGQKQVPMYTLGDQEIFWQDLWSPAGQDGSVHHGAQSQDRGHSGSCRKRGIQQLGPVPGHGGLPAPEPSLQGDRASFQFRHAGTGSGKILQTGHQGTGMPARPF